MAVVIGIGSALLLRPGSYIDRSVLDAALGADSAVVPLAATPTGPPGMAEIPTMITGLFPTDPLTTFTSGNMLQIVIAAMILGVAVVMTPADQRRPLLELLASVQAACMVIVGFVLRFAPLAVFGLLAQLSARIGVSALIGTGMYVVAVVSGLVVLFAFYMLALRIFGNYSPIAFLRATRDVLLLAFSTSSSAAVMPATLTTTEKKLGVDMRVSPASSCLWAPPSTWQAPHSIRPLPRCSSPRFSSWKSESRE